MVSEDIKSNRFFYIILTALIIISILYFYPMLVNYISYLYNNDDYSYGLLLPFVAAYIVYLKWPLLKEYRYNPTLWGIVIILAALAMYIIGELAADLYVPRFSFVISLAGIVVLVGGWKLLRLLLFPLFLLIIMIPLPQLVTFKLTLPLQLLSSQLATVFLRLLGVPVLLQGNIIDLGVRQMQVVDACSGLRYILALIALGIVFCYFYQRRLWKAALLVLAMIPAAIFANAFRLALMGIYPIFLDGFWHSFSGWLIFLLCLLILFLLNAILNRLVPVVPAANSPAAASNPGNPLPPEASAGVSRNKVLIYAGLALFIYIVFIPVANRAAQAPSYPLKQKLETFPMELDGWQGRQVYIDPALVLQTKSHAHLNADYHDAAGHLVNLWIAYYETQKKAGGFVHSPKGCFLGSGWAIKEVKIQELGSQQPVVEMIVEQRGERLLVYYWYLQRGRWLANETWNKIYMAYDGMVKRRTDGALVRLITPVGNDLEQARKRLTAFANLITPILPNYIPN